MVYENQTVKDIESLLKDTGFYWDYYVVPVGSQHNKTGDIELHQFGGANEPVAVGSSPIKGHIVQEYIEEQEWYRNRLEIGFKKLSDRATIPTRAHETDSGYDLFAADSLTLEPGDTAVIGTDIEVLLPEGYEAQVRPRSGITSRTKLRVQLGTIDNGYSGGIGIIVDNTASSLYEPYVTETMDIEGEPVWGLVGEVGSYRIREGDKIAQLVVQKLPKTYAVEYKGEFSRKNAERGNRGYGSSGVRL